MSGDPLLRLIDAEAGGDVSRVIIDGIPRLDGDSVAAQCRDFARRYDHLRLKLMQPPHGELHMCPVLLLPPRTGDSDFGAIIMESMGYPPISGSNLFCAAAVALEYGFAVMREPETHLRVETPAGIVAVNARCGNGRCRSVEFENTPARIASSMEGRLAPRADPVAITIISAGVDYAVVDAGRLGIALTPGAHDELIRSGRQAATLAGTDFTLFHDRLTPASGESRCTLAVYQSPGVICRSPTGTGTSAMLALAYSRGLIAADDTLAAASPGGSVFRGRILRVQGSPAPVVHTAISGEVRLVGETVIP